MLRSLIWYIYFPLGLILYMPRIKKLEKSKGKVSDFEFFKNANQIAQEWSNNYLKIAKMDVEVIGKENIINDRAVLFVSNHQSNFDTAVYLNMLGVPVAYIAKKQLSNIPILSRMMKNMSSMFIDRKDIKNSAQTMIEAMELLRKGFSVFVYPEGTRGNSPEMAEFPSTAIKIAVKTGVPIVPFTISGTYDAMEGNNNIIKPTKVKVVVHKPIETSELTAEQKKSLHKEVHELIKSELVFDLNKK